MKECRYFFFGLSAVCILLFLFNINSKGSIEWQSALFAFFHTCYVSFISKTLLMFDLIETVFFFCIGFDTILSTSSNERNGLVNVSFTFRHSKNSHEHNNIEHCSRVRIIGTGNNTVFYAFLGYILAH